jgi:signal transduction histidine kinase/CheY-like chemotaxis protein
MNLQKPKHIGIALMALLGITFIFILITLYHQHRQALRLTDTVDVILGTRPKYEVIENTLSNLYKLENDLRLYINLKEQSYLQAYQLSLATLERQIGNVNDHLNRHNHNLEGTGSTSEALLSLKKELGKEMVIVQAKLDGLIDSLNKLPSLETYSINSIPLKVDKKDAMASILNDTLILKDTLKRRNFIGRLTDVFKDDSDKVNDQYIVLTKESLEYFIVDKSVDQILKKANAVYASNVQKLIDQREQLQKIEESLLKTNSELVQEIQGLMGKARNMETLVSDNRLESGIAQLNSGTFQLMKLNRIIAIMLLLIILIMAWFLIKNIKYEQQLLESKEKAIAIADERSNFLASMSHEIRTPLNSIVGFTDLLARTELNKEQEEMLDAAKVSAKVLLSMVNDILDIGKLENGKFKPREIPFKPVEVLNYVVHTINLQARVKQLPITFKCNFEEQLEVIGDDLLLRQIVLNLLSNAVKFTQEGRIDVEANLNTVKGKSYITYTVRDTGSGIPNDKIKHLFTKYFSSDTDKQVGGTGLGLYICKLMAENLKGEINVHSEYGKGSVFEVIVPYQIVAKNLQNTDIRHLNGHHKKSLNTISGKLIKKSFVEEKTFLVVDDNPLNIKLMYLLVKKWGANMISASDGLEALDKLKTDKVDLIMTDIMMPNLDGFGLAEAIKSSQNGISQLPIIALTADILTDKSKDSKYNIFETVVTKPINEEELYFKLVAVLSQVEAKSDYSNHN